MLELPALEIERHELGNGLRVVLHRDDSLPLVAVNLWYHAGSKNERPGKTGFAHLFEHMLFQGSVNVPDNDHFRLVQQVGGVANGSTWYDRTNYFETLPAGSLELALWLESDRMGFLLPAMTQEKLDKQREVVINERRQRVDNQPYGRASERLNELLFPDQHPYGWPVIGYMEDIEAATLDDVRTFFSTYYAPNNAVLTLAGDFDPGKALDLVQSYFGGFPAAPDAPAVERVANVRSGDPCETLEDAIQLSRSYIAYRIPPFGKPAWYAADLLAAVLTGGKASRLYRDLVYERELAQSIVAHALPTEMEGSFHIVATAKPDVAIEELESEVLLHIANIAESGPSDDELARAKNKILTAHFNELQTLDRRADLLSLFTTYFDAPEDLHKEAIILQSIQLRDVQDVAQTYLVKSQRARLRVVAKGAAG